MINMIMLHILWADYIKRYYGHVQLQEGELAEKKKRKTQHKNKTPKQEEISQKESERKR